VSLSATGHTNIACAHLWTVSNIKSHWLDIHRVTDWASEWLLKLNVDKCCGISFMANVNSLCDTQYYIEDSRARHKLIKVDSVSDLGVKFDFNLCFWDHVNEKISKAYSVLGVIKRNFIYLDKNTVTLLNYKAMVRTTQIFTLFLSRCCFAE